MSEQDRAEQDRAERGRLVIADRVVRRVAAAAATEVAGVVRTAPALPGGLGSRLPGTGAGLPQAEVTVAGHRARVRVEVAVHGGTPLPELAGQVRDRVRHRLEALTQVRADAVDVCVVRVVAR